MFSKVDMHLHDESVLPLGGFCVIKRSGFTKKILLKGPATTGKTSV